MEGGHRSMNTISIVVHNLSKEFNRRPIFSNLSFSLSSPVSLAIIGKNGAGKSTLLKILGGLISATRGTVSYTMHEKNIDMEEFKQQVGFVSPYLNLYDEFTAMENLQLLSSIRAATQRNEQRIEELLNVVDLWNRRNDLVGTFSSGMKQRLKYAFALIHEPKVLILDEPTSNLDTEGIEFVQTIVNKQKKEGILVVATNNKEEADWCTQAIQVGMTVPAVYSQRTT
jgi:heme exporter protein A